MPVPECDELPDTLQDCLRRPENPHAMGSHSIIPKPIASAAGMTSSPSSPSWWNHHISLSTMKKVHAEAWHAKVGFPAPGHRERCGAEQRALSQRPTIQRRAVSKKGICNSHVTSVSNHLRTLEQPGLVCSTLHRGHLLSRNATNGRKRLQSPLRKRTTSSRPWHNRDSPSFARPSADMSWLHVVATQDEFTVKCTEI